MISRCYSALHQPPLPAATAASCKHGRPATQRPKRATPPHCCETLLHPIQQSPAELLVLVANPNLQNATLDWRESCTNQIQREGLCENPPSFIQLKVLSLSFFLAHAFLFSCSLSAATSHLHIGLCMRISLGPAASHS